MAPKYQDHRQHIDALIEAALGAADPAAAVRNHLKREGRHLRIGSRRYDLGRGKVYLVAVGKGAIPMGTAAAEIIGSELAAGILVSKRREQLSPELLQAETPPPNLSLMVGGHPVSDEQSIQAAAAVIELLSGCNAGDLVLCLISGGASALIAAPTIPLPAWQELSRILLDSGCTIGEFNLVRRHLDRLKGGGLARTAAPADCVSLVLSDVVGNRLEIIGSGPTVPTQPTPVAALEILRRFRVAEKCEPATWELLAEALKSDLAQTSPLAPEPLNLIIADGRGAAEASLIRAAQLGFMSRLVTARLKGEAREVALVVSAMAKDAPALHCLILAGETTVTLRGSGQGGRNQEVALAAAIELDGWPGIAIGCFATDGEDGNSDAAGACINGTTAGAARLAAMDPRAYLDENDSYRFFENLENQALSDGEQLLDSMPGGLIKTGPTGTNVNDLLFVLTYPHENGNETAPKRIDGRPLRYS